MVEPPEHIVLEGLAEILTVGDAFTLTTNVAGVVFEQPNVLVTVTLYVVVLVGFAIVESFDVFDKEPAGLHA